jgi:hypothetical protein
MPNGERKTDTLGGGKTPGPAGVGGPADSARGPPGLQAGAQLSQGAPALDPPKGILLSKVFSFFDDRVRVLVCLMPHPAPTRETLKDIRTTTGIANQIGYTEAALKSTGIKETKVEGKSWFTAIAKLSASAMVVPKDLWVEETKIRAEKDAQEAGRLRAYRAAYDDILLHEQKHMTEAYDWLSDVTLGYHSAWGSSSSSFPDLKTFRAVVEAGDAKAGAEEGPIKKSARAWDARDLEDIRGRQREIYITIDRGMDPEIHYHPPRNP